MGFGECWIWGALMFCLSEFFMMVLMWMIAASWEQEPGRLVGLHSCVLRWVYCLQKALGCCRYLTCVHSLGPSWVLWVLKSHNLSILLPFLLGLNWCKFPLVAFLMQWNTELVEKEKKDGWLVNISLSIGVVLFPGCYLLVGKKKKSNLINIMHTPSVGECCASVPFIYFFVVLP